MLHLFCSDPNKVVKVPLKALIIFINRNFFKFLFISKYFTLKLRLITKNISVTREFKKTRKNKFQKIY